MAILQAGNCRANVVLVASFLTQMLVCTMPNTVGVYYVALSEKHREFSEVISWICSLYLGTSALAGPLGGVITNVFSCRTCVMLSGVLGLVGLSCSSLVTDVRFLFLTLSLISGVSASFAYTASISVLGFYFPQHTAVVCGIALTGTGLGVFLQPSLARYLIDTFGTSGAFLISGGISSHALIFGLLMKPSKSEKERNKSVGDRKVILKSILCGSCLNAKSIMIIPTFSFLWFSTLFFGLAFSATLTYMPDYFKSRGATFEEAAFSVSMQGIGNVLSRVLVGFAANDEKIGGGLLYASIMSLVCLISWFITFFANGIGGMYAYGLLLGIYAGGILALISIRTFDIVGVHRFANSFGLVFFALGLGLVIGSPIAGVIYKTTKVYTDAFLFVSCMFSASASFGVMSTMCSRKPTSSDDIKDSEKNQSEGRSSQQMEPMLDS